MIVQRQPIRVPLPAIRQTVGIGSAIAQVLANAGVRPCSKCEERKDALNRLLQFVPRRPR